MDAVRAADADRELVFERAALERVEQLYEVGVDQVGRARELDRKTGIEHVRRRHAEMHEARLRPDDFREMRQEGDHVVARLAFDLVDACDVELRVLALVPDFFRRFLRDHAEFGHGVGGMGLDLEPDAEARLGRPDGGGFGPAVARDHNQAASPRASAAALRIAEILAR
jgi:hypothetical protein